MKLKVILREPRMFTEILRIALETMGLTIALVTFPSVSQKCQGK